ncbi:MAG: hypothetical protein KGH61_03640 [Candidatus Micrarchaeota archaeon]|nr:hypothetical protein [Candidatus Micrarchaeota archaeon]MDE1848015.1 hypothetical protein [Candidatus Micrarchaeota archaeon]MDE1864608.1 hypothetical protein [Candidatus Micrarchaeota archaeon]
MVTIPNIYTSKNVRYYIVIPIILMLIGILLSTHLSLDSSLSGGVSLTLQTNATLNAQQISSQIGSALKVSTPSIFQSSGEIQITIPNNKSLVNGEDYLLNFYAYQANYTTSYLNATTLQNALLHSPSNTTLAAALAAENKSVEESLKGMNTQLSLELGALSPFVGTPSYNSSNPANMTQVAQSAYVGATAYYKQKVLTTVKSLVPFTTYTYQQVTPTLGRYFLGQFEAIVIAAFVLISIAVLIVFRSWAPALAIIFGAGNDMVIALGAMVVLNIPLGLASLGGLLMLIGYAIDTEMLTAVRILKRREGTPEERAYHAMKTGLTMTTAAIVSFAVLFIVSIIAYVPTYYEISGVVLFGLLADILTTWLGNTPIILMYKKRHDRGG